MRIRAQNSELEGVVWTPPRKSAFCQYHRKCRKPSTVST